MRKILLLCFCFAMTICGFSQEQSDSSSVKYTAEHVKFMGIPMEGPFDDFRDKVIAKGFRFDMINDLGYTILEGTFAGHHASILMLPNRNNEIYRIQLILADGNQYFTSWKRISNLYYELKNLLISKYGDPEECTEEFKGKRPTTDKDRILAVANENCNYHCLWGLYGKGTYESNHMTFNLAESRIGSIGLHIAEQVVRLTYIDLQQETKQEQQNLDDI